MSIIKAPVGNFKGKIDLAIITIRVDEYEALLYRLPTEVFVQGRQTYSVSSLMAHDGTRYSIALIRCPEQGNATSQAVTHNVIEDLDPQWLVVAGIAGSIPAVEHTLGDVVIASRLQDFSISASIENAPCEFDVRGGPMHPTIQSLVAAIPAIEPHLDRWNTPEMLTVERPKVNTSSQNYYGDEAWQKKVRESIEIHFGPERQRLPKVFTGSIASSDVLVKNTELAKQWLMISRQLLGIEMELSGVYQAAWNAQKPVLAVRGISDIVGLKRSPDWTRYACHTAASFLVSLLRGYPPITPRLSKNATSESLADAAKIEADSDKSSVASSLFLPVDSSRTHHYSARALPLLGREKAIDILRKFTANAAGFRWMQIAGAGGQGKSRLALELALELKKDGWSAGFLKPQALSVHASLWRHWLPKKPTLIITDYVIGYEREIGKAMRDLAAHENLQVPVCWLILERQRWDRGYFDIEIAEEGLEQEVVAGSRHSFGGIADWFVRLSENRDMRDLNIERAKFEPSVIDLKALKEEELVAIVKQWSVKRNITIEVSDRELGDMLARIDPTGRPLYAYFLAEAFALDFPKEGWKRENLLRATLSRDQHYRWSQYFSGAPPTLGDDVPSLRLAMLATIVGTLDVKLLKGRDGGAIPTSDVRRQALALVDAPIGSDVSGPREFIPKLEPDILGGWFILDIASHAVIDVEMIFATAWDLSPKETSATLLRIAQDFPTHPKLLDLLVIDPPSQHGQQAFTDIALGLLMAIRDKVRIYRIGIIPRIQSAAENGDAYAMAKLGMCYKEGIGLTEPNIEKAFYWFERGALAGNGRAMAYLGHCYFSGAGVKEADFDEAFKWFKKGAETGDGHAMCYLGICYHVGIGVERNVKEAVKWFARGGTAGDGLAMVYLGLMLLDGDGIDRNPEQAFENFKRGADLGSAHAMAYLGKCYEKGIGVEKNFQRAVDWYRKGSDSGSGHAMAHLGLCYLHGTDVTKADPLAAVDLFKKGVEAGSGFAMAQLGNCYDEGLGVPRDATESVRLWIRAAKLNDEGAINTLKEKGISWK